MPDLLKLTVAHTREVAADRADVHVTIRGASVVQGNMALKKAREVSQLAEALRALGLPEDAIELQSAAVDVAAGPLAKASSATYRLRIRWPDVATLPSLLGAIAGQKQASLDTIVWRYPEDPQEADRWTAQNIRRANEKARLMAAELGVRIVGVHQVEEAIVESGARPPLAAPQSKLGDARARSLGPEDFGLDIIHRKTVEVRLTIAYRLSAIETPA